jgi:large repetitive protein
MARLGAAAAPPLTLTFNFTSDLADVGVSLVDNEFEGTASGGVPPYSFSTSGSVPPGVSLSPSGGTVIVLGVPSSVADYGFTVIVTDSARATASVGLNLDVLADVRLLTTSLPSGVKGSAYSVSLQASGGYASSGYGAYNWSASGLPPGLSLNPSSGVISGIPTSGGSFPVSVTVADYGGGGVGTSASGSFTISISSPVPQYPLTISASPVAGGTVSPSSGSSYPAGTVVPILATASSQYVFTSWSGSVANPASASTTVTMSAAESVTANFTLIGQLTISPTTLPAATEGVAYAAVTFAASGGSGSGFLWSVSGQPAGLAINSSTGVFNGTPAAGTSASSPYTLKVSVTDSSGNSNSVQIALIVNPPPATGITVSANSLSFSYVQGGSAPVAQSFGVLATGGPAKYSVAASTTSGGSWLAASPGGVQTTPNNVTVSLQNLAGLTVGTYQGSVQVQPQGSLSPQSVSVTLTVAPASPVMSLSSTDLRFSLNAASPAASGTIQVINTGGGSLSYSVSGSPVSWLTITCGSSGSVIAASPGLICFQVNPAGLQADTYSDTLAVSGAGQQTNVTVTLQVSSAATSIVLSATAMTFTAIAGSASVFPASQTSAVLNSGSATMNWTAQVDPLTPAALSWLSLSPASGSSQPFGGSQPAITFTPNPAGLKAGNYYALIDVGVPDGSASNSPAQITILLKILPAGSPLPPGASTSGLIFIAPVGGTATAAQPLNLINGAGAQVAFSCLLWTALTDAGQTIPEWIGPASPPAAGTVPGSGTFPMSVQANPAGLPAGTYRSQFRLAFSNGTTENVDVTLLVTAASSGVETPASRAEGASAAAVLPDSTSACSNYALSFVGLSPTNGSTVFATQGYELQLSAGCIPSTPSALNALIYFSDGTPSATPQFDSASQTYETSWTPTVGSIGTTVTIQAQANPANQVGALVPVQPVKSSFNVAANPGGAPSATGVSNAAFAGPANAVAGGSFISIYGSQIANSAVTAGTVPFSNILGGIQVTLAGTPLPLYYASPTQINAIVPFLGSQDLNTQRSLVVSNNCSAAGTGCNPASPLSMYVSAVQPGIFPYPAPGEPPQQGAIENANASNQVADPNNPATPGDTIAIYGSGLGQVNNPPPVGAAASGGSTTISTPTVYIGGIQALVTYSGLSPGSVDLYQVDAVVPQGIPSGTINVYLTMPDPTTGAAVPSNTVTIN